MNLLLIATYEYLPLYVMQCLHNPDIRIFVMGVGKFSYSRFSRYCNKYLSCTKEDLTNPDLEFIAKFNNFCKENMINIVVPTGGWAVAIVSRTGVRINRFNIIVKYNVIPFLCNIFSI